MTINSRLNANYHVQKLWHFVLAQIQFAIIKMKLDIQYQIMIILLSQIFLFLS